MTRRHTRFVAILLAAATLFALAPVASASNEGEDEDAPAAVAPEAGALVVEMGVFSTMYTIEGRAENRAHNVELAARNLDGVVLMPGEELSFNEQVGERSVDAGFRNAPVIANGRIRQGLGGGICQVASTLHAAALEAGFDVVEHRPHSRTSSYIDPGLDATVVWGRVDFRVKNTHPFPVRVSSKAHLGEVRIALLGLEAPADSRVETEVLRRVESPEQIVADPTLPAGERTVERRGRSGLLVEVTHLAADGELRTRRVRYGATPTIVHVGGASAAGV